MEYTIIVDSRSYDLPKKTVAVMEKLDDVLKVDSVKGLSLRQKFEKLHNFVKDVVGEENAKEIFGSDNISEIDLSEVTLAVKKIADAYDKPIKDYESEKMQRSFDGIPMEKIISMTKAANTIATMPQQK